MKNKTFTWISSLISGILGVIIAISIINGNFIIPLIAMALGTLATATLKMKVTDIITDERLDRIAGKASKIVYIVTTYALAIATVIFAALSKNYESFFGYAMITATTEIGMLLLYIVTLSYYSNKKA